MRKNFTDMEVKLLQERIAEKRNRIPPHGVTFPPPSPNQNKFRNKKVDSPDGKFDSTKEHAKWIELRGRLVSGKFKSLERQITFGLTVNGRLICSYIADFVITHLDGRVEVQDTKSDFTRKHPVYRIKKKLMLAVHGIEIVEV